MSNSERKLSAGLVAGLCAGYEDRHEAGDSQRFIDVIALLSFRASASCFVPSAPMLFTPKRCSCLRLTNI